MNKKIPLLVLIGGLGTRIKKVYPDLPKFLIPINATYNFADYWISSLNFSFISKIYFLTGYKSNMIEDYLSKKNLPVSFEILNEGNNLLGTGGAIKKACNKLNTPFFVTYGDSILDINWNKMKDLFYVNQPPLILSVVYNEGLTDKSNIEINNNNQIYYNKKNTNSEMKYIDYGLSIINIKDFIRSTIHLEIFDLADWYHYITLKYPNIPFLNANGRYYEIGTPHALDDFRKNFKD